MRHMRMGVIGGVRARADHAAEPTHQLGALDPDAMIWRGLVAAFARHNPDAPLERAGHAAARGLLDLMARCRPAGGNAQPAAPGRASTSTNRED